MIVWRKHNQGSTENMSDCQTVRQRGDFISRWFYDGGYMLLHVCQAQMEANSRSLSWIRGQERLYSKVEATSLGYSARPHGKTKARIQCVNTEWTLLWWAAAWPGAPGPRWLMGCNRYTGMSQHNDAQKTAPVFMLVLWALVGKGQQQCGNRLCFPFCSFLPGQGLAMYLKVTCDAHPSCLYLPSAKSTSTSHHQAFPQL